MPVRRDQVEKLKVLGWFYNMKKFRYFLEYIFIFCLGYVIRPLPRKVVLYLGKRAGDFIFYCAPVRKKITIEQLRISFPEKTAHEIYRIARGVYQNLAMNSLEHLCLPGLSQEELSKIVRIENEDVMQKALSRNKGIVVVGGHFGNWEYPGSAVSSKGYEVAYVVADIDNPYINKMVNEHRQKAGVKVHPKGMSIRGILSTLRNNGSIGMLMDQDAGRAGVFVEFFGRPCSTPGGPALFALKTGAAIIFMSSIRQQDGTLKLVFDEIDVDYSVGATEENIFDISQRCTSRLEFYTRKYPEQWFWMHRRWKTRPLQTVSQ